MVWRFKRGPAAPAEFAALVALAALAALAAGRGGRQAQKIHRLGPKNTPGPKNQKRSNLRTLWFGDSNADLQHLRHLRQTGAVARPGK